MVAGLVAPPWPWWPALCGPRSFQNAQPSRRKTRRSPEGYLDLLWFWCAERVVCTGSHAFEV